MQSEQRSFQQQRSKDQKGGTPANNLHPRHKSLRVLTLFGHKPTGRDDLIIVGVEKGIQFSQAKKIGPPKSISCLFVSCCRQTSSQLRPINWTARTMTIKVGRKPLNSPPRSRLIVRHKNVPKVNWDYPY